MALTNREHQAKFKARMYEAGYMQKQVWIKRDPVKRPVKTFAAFVAKMEKLTAGWQEASLARLFGLLVKITEAKKEENAQKNKN